jgi:nucleoside-diphosphate-sugar epimerase
MKVLVTGGTGFVGGAVVSRLIEDGCRVRVLARGSANIDRVVALGAEVTIGDMTDTVSFGRALSGCDVVVHLAAGTRGSAEDRDATLTGTRTLIEVCRTQKPRRLVYVSSCSVYGVADYDDNSVVTETSSLERFPERRGFYSESKRKAEEYVADFMKAGNVPVVIVRPGAVYGPGCDLFPGMMGFAVGSTYLVIGDGSFVPPFVNLDNVAGAISACVTKEEASGEIFNVIDPTRITKREYVDRVIRRIDPGARVVYLPFSIVYCVTWILELVGRVAGRPPVLTRYRLKSSQKPVVFDGSRIARQLGWKPKHSVDDALDQLVRSVSSQTAAAHNQGETNASANRGVVYGHDRH